MSPRCARKPGRFCDIGVNVPSIDVEMGVLSGSQRQSVLIGRFIHWGGKIALLDEPFAALGVAESRRALQLVRDVSKQGLPIILITHNIEYALQVITKYGSATRQCGGSRGCGGSDHAGLGGLDHRRDSA